MNSPRGVHTEACVGGGPDFPRWHPLTSWMRQIEGFQKAASGGGALLLAEADATEEIGEPRVAAKRIETRPQEHTRIETVRRAAFEPGHRLITVAERRIDDGHFGGIRVKRARTLPQIHEQRH